jgi:hypothetical protein
LLDVERGLFERLDLDLAQVIDLPNVTQFDESQAAVPLPS